MKKNIIIIVTLLTLLLSGCTKAEELKNPSSEPTITEKSGSNSSESLVSEEKDWEEWQDETWSIVSQESISNKGYRKNYDIDILDISFPYTIICYAYNDFTILYDEETEEIVCVRNSEEIGPRNKVEKKILEDYLSGKHSNLYYSYFIENEAGISFNILRLWKNIESEAYLSKKNSNKIDFSFGSTLGFITTYNSKIPDYNSTYFKGEKLYSYFTPKPSYCKDILCIDRHHIPYKMSYCHVFQENFTLDTVEYQLENLKDFTIVLYQVPESERIELYAYAQIDNCHEAIIWNPLLSEKLNMETYAEYAYDIQNCELSNFFDDYYGFEGKTPYEKCYVVPFSVLIEILENNF